MDLLQNYVHIECEMQFANSQFKLGSRSSRMVLEELAAPGEDKEGQKSFHTSTAPTNLGRNR